MVTLMASDAARYTPHNRSFQLAQTPSLPPACHPDRAASIAIYHHALVSAARATSPRALPTLSPLCVYPPLPVKNDTECPIPDDPRSPESSTYTPASYLPPAPAPCTNSFRRL